MIKLFCTVLFAGMSLAVHAFSWTSYQDTRHLTAATGDDKAQVTEQGLAFSKTIQTATPRQLQQSLGLYEPGLRSHAVNVDQTQLAVREYFTTSGTPQYQAVVKVSYHYDVQSRSRD